MRCFIRGRVYRRQLVFAVLLIVAFSLLIFEIERVNLGFELVKNDFANYPFAKIYDRKDWHDYEFIEYEKLRKGPGEHGAPVKLTDPQEIEDNQILFETEGFYQIVSDKISVNRSVPDTRLPQCGKINYLKVLPPTSVIVIYHNEHLSVLLRTIHSLYNRTPHELLHEILMVNDASTKKELYEPLQKYVQENFDDRVRIVDLKERKGLIVTRMEGARRATGEVLVFLDSHIEANVNWLPPLLEPIAIDPKSSTVPIVDNFSPETFEYFQSEGSRGVFDWNFVYHWLPLRPEDKIHPEQPTPLPVMLGCAFAIRRDYFFDLGGYDEQLMIWNGENYELSFKLWLCGGKLLEVPCSRVAHFFRKSVKSHYLPDFDNVGFNFKRIAEVWLDDYKKYLYQTDPKRFDAIDPGDLTREKLIRKNLNCKPFQYFLEFVAPDMLERYPFESPGVFASGVIRSEADMNFCVNSLNQEANAGNPLSLYPCDPLWDHEFVFSWHRHIMAKNDPNEVCLDVYKASLYTCHYTLGNQLWFYNLTTHQLLNSPENCLTVNMDTKFLDVEPCDETEVNQKWQWGYLNVSAVENWESFGVKLN